MVVIGYDLMGQIRRVGAAVRLRFAEICGGAPAGAFVEKIAGACGGASLLQGLSKHAYPAGVVCNRLRRGEVTDR